MDVLAFSGSPRRGGNTETLLAAVLEGVGKAGGRFESIRLADLKISPCTGCGGCEQTGKCVIDDDMQGLYEKILATRKIIIASPIYFYALTAQTKAFIDRGQALWSRKRILVKEKKWQVDADRQGYLLSVAATHGEKVFEGARLCVQYAYDAMGFHYAGDLLVRGKDQRDEMKQDQATLQKAVTFGRQIMQTA